MAQNQNDDTPSPERLERAAKFEAQFQPRDLTSASLQEVGQAAIDYTLAQFSVLSGTPEVALVQPVTSADLSSLGLADINFVNQEPPLALVILKGNFDVSNMIGRVPRGVKRQNKVKYIAYAFDLRAGTPTLTTTALYGEKLRQALQDSSLPDIPKLSGPDGYKPPSEIPAITNPRRATKLPYGSVAPPVELPSREELPPPEPPPSESVLKVPIIFRSAPLAPQNWGELDSKSPRIGGFRGPAQTVQYFSNALSVDQ